MDLDTDSENIIPYWSTLTRECVGALEFEFILVDWFIREVVYEEPEFVDDTDHIAWLITWEESTDVAVRSSAFSNWEV